MRRIKGNSTAIIVLIILVISAAIIYFIWAGKGTTGTPAPDKTTQEIQTQGASTEVSAIESDLNATSFTSVDSDLIDIETELNAALSEQ